VTAAGRGGIPLGATSVTVALATSASPASGSLTVYPAGSGRPSASTLVWAAAQSATGQAIVRLSGTGKVSVSNAGRRAVTLTIRATGYVLGRARTVTDITQRKTTTREPATAITQVTGSPGGSQTVTLAKGAAVPAVKGALVASPSGAAPAGLLGTATSVTSGAGGTHIVTLAPASLSQAYSTFNVSTSQQVTPSEITEPAAAPSDGRASPGRAAAGSATGFGFSLGSADFDCSGSGAGPTVTLTADLSDTSVDLTLDANPQAPSIHFLITSDPVFDVNVGFTGQLTCTLPVGKVMKVRIPVPGAPGLEVDLSPVVTLTAGGQASVDFQWKPRFAVGFDRGPGINSNAVGFGSSGSVAVSATAGADLFLGLAAELSLAGRIGVGGDVGPDLGVTYDASSACIEVDGEVKADLTADADVLVKDWTFALATGIFAKTELYRKCLGTSSGGPVITSTTLPTATVGTSYSARLTTADNRAGSWTITSGSLPPGLSQSGATISGKPTTKGSYTFHVKFTDAVGRTAVATVTLAVSAAGGGGPGVGSAIEAPLPANAASDPNAVVNGESCPTTTYCVAVGTYWDGANGPQAGLLLTWSGGTWTAAQAPGVTGSAQEFLFGVSCPSTSFCIAVGGTQGGPDDLNGLILTWSNGTWTEQAGPPLPAGAAAAVTRHGISPAYIQSEAPSIGSVSCPSAAYCVAVEVSGDNGSTPYALTWSGGSWTITSLPVPGNSDASGFLTVQSVSCPTTSFCVAVGDYETTGQQEGGLLLTRSGGAWKATEAPPVPQADYGLGLYSVSCPSASFCVAGGNGAFVTLSGGSWTTTWATSPANVVPGDSAETSSQVDAVSCPTTSYCAAVGTYSDADTKNQAGDLLTLSGGSWHATTLPLPSNADPANTSGYPLPAAVDCLTASFCTTGGSYLDTSGNYDAMVSVS
jgi:hypothetical protein